MDNNSQNIGGKTLKLQDLKSLGLNVPEFTFITADEIVNLVDDKDKINQEKLEAISQKIAKNLHCERYAVRSSALIEDSDIASFAGQFKTKIDVAGKDMPEAIKEVAEQAKEFLKGNLSKFSILVQDYIQADFSGISFTRNPLGSREMIIEYHQGIGEDIVSGKVEPKKLSFYWTNTSEKAKSELPSIDEAIQNFQKIENFYNNPQDIEWCIKDGIWYFLQTRPITTISSLQFEEFQYLDKTLPKNEKFYFAKTEISEIAPRPSEFTLHLLEKIYGQRGPIEKVYKKYKITYFPKDFIKIIGNELYIDHEAELKSLLPCYSYLNENLSPAISTFSGLISTFKNIYHLNKIGLENHQEIFQKLKGALEDKLKFSSLNEAIEKFLTDYELIFEVNLLAGIAINKLKRELKDDNKIAEALNSNNLAENFPIGFSSEDLKGNCLEITDESDFIRHFSQEKKSPQESNKTLAQAQIYNHFRELGRWLTVKRINQLRHILGSKSKRNQSFDKFQFPAELSWKPRTNNSKITIVSTGTASGILVTEEQIAKSTDNSPKILYTKMLSPHLAQYFPQIKGIISEQGGLLSHLAILCREAKIPAIVGFNLQSSAIKICDMVELTSDPNQPLLHKP